MAEAMYETPSPNAVAVYHRATNFQLAGPGKADLTEKAAAVRDRLCREAWLDPAAVEVFSGVEKGYPRSRRRPALVKALEYLRGMDGPGKWLVVGNPTRLLKPDPGGSVLTPDHWYALLKRVPPGVRLVSLADPRDPACWPGEAMRVRGRPLGRPPRIAPDVVPEVLRALGRAGWDGRWERSIRDVAILFGVAKSVVDDLLDRELPGRPGKRLREFDYPYAAWMMASGKPGTVPRGPEPLGVCR